MEWDEPSCEMDLARWAPQGQHKSTKTLDLFLWLWFGPQSGFGLGPTVALVWAPEWLQFVCGHRVAAVCEWRLGLWCFNI